MRAGSLFSGIGGLDLAVEAVTGARTVWQVERDAWCRGVLAKHWPEAQRFDDVCRVGEELEHVDIIAGGFPCQDLSHAGKRAGLAGERSGLWREFARIIRVVGPRFVFVENVSGLLSDSGAMGAVLGDLAAMGFSAEWGVFRASDVGAPHRRERLFLLAYRDDCGGQGTDARSEGAGRHGSVGDGADVALSDRGGCGSDGLAGVGGSMGLRGGDPRDAAAPANAGSSGLADAIGGRRDGIAHGASGHDRVGPTPRREEGADWAADGGAGAGARDLADAHGLRQRQPQGRFSDRGGRTGDGGAHVGVGQADPNGEHREERDGAAKRSGAQHAVGRSRSGRDGIGAAEPRVGGDAHGLSARLAQHRWPAGRGEAQHEWEPPRVAEGIAGRARHLRALGNAVVPQQAALALTVLAERMGVVKRADGITWNETRREGAGRDGR